MTYGEARDRALHLIHQKSIAGDTIPGTYDNQQDYLDKIPGLINAAEMDLATTVRKIQDTTFLGKLRFEELGGTKIYRLPQNAYRLRGSGLLVPVHGRYVRYNKMRMIGNLRFALRDHLPDDAIIEYFRYPERLGDSPADDEELDNTEDVQEIIPLYVAAHLVMQDDAFMYASLYNEYEAKKSEMVEPVYVEQDTVIDEPYNFYGGI